MVASTHHISLYIMTIFGEILSDISKYGTELWRQLLTKTVNFNYLPCKLSSSIFLQFWPYQMPIKRFTIAAPLVIGIQGN